jgi:acetylornithine/N-succinyldiaminopimelate aminotransferase
MTTKETMKIEDNFMIPFFNKKKVSIERGEGIFVYDEEMKKYIDFTSGWGVTSLGHAHPVILEALQTQAGKIMQNPNSGLTYSPARAQLLLILKKVLPDNLTNFFFTNSGAEANDVAIKLARKTTGRTDIISTHQSFHGRTISTASATGQAKHRDKFNPLMPNYRFVNFDDIPDLKNAMDKNVAAVILEPIQGEGGVHVPLKGYLKEVEKLCTNNGSMLIVDEIQTGFCRTGPMFVTAEHGVKADFLTMAKGIAGGFPFGAFAVSDRVAQRIEIGDHGGTYCGNPLGCAVAHAVINYMIENRISENVKEMGKLFLKKLSGLHSKYPNMIREIRGKGLLLLVDFHKESVADQVTEACLLNSLLVTQTNGTGIRIFPALNITAKELDEGILILDKVISKVVQE